MNIHEKMFLSLNKTLRFNNNIVNETTKIETNKTIVNELFRLLFPESELLYLTITWSWPNLEKEVKKLMTEIINNISPDSFILK